MHKKNNKKSTKRNSTDSLDRIKSSLRITYDISWNVILFFLIVGFIGIFFAGGIGAGYFASLVKDEPVRSYASMKDDIYNYEETSKLYFSDNLYFGDVNADLHRDDTTLDKISKTLTNAVIATEDEYFYQHKGVVPKAILRAVVQEATNANMKTGGSTLTQQLIKLQVLSNEVSFDRKAKEILLALRLESVFNKDEILEAYLNIIPYGRNASGRNIAGVQTAAKGIFGINADEVNLAQAAYLAGLPQNPYTFTPFQNGGGLKDEAGIEPGVRRMHIVLKRMLDSNFINEAEYKNALNYDIVADFIEKTSSPNEKYPYLTNELEERAKEILIPILAEKDGYTIEDISGNNEDSKNLRAEYEEIAKRQLRRNGYNIHSTIDKSIYDNMQAMMKEIDYLGPERTVTDKVTGKQKTERVQAAALLKDNNTGRIISFVGGPGYERGKSEISYINRVRPNGSTMKPLYYAVAMENGDYQPGSPIPDVRKTYNDGSSKGYTPRNYVETAYYGMNSARHALTHSYNVSSIYLYNQIKNKNITQNYIEKMGISNLKKPEYNYLNFAIGRTDLGIKIEENISAFQTFGNNGQFIEEYMIDKITTQNGEVIYQHESEPVQVFSPETAYLTIDMMRDVISSGTATFASTQLNNRNVDWAGKTGTSEKHNDLWFVATNPNVTFGVWMGYDTPADLRTTCVGCSLEQHQRVQKLWAQLVNSAASINPELVSPSERFKRPEGVVERSYCAISGMLPSELCKRVGLITSDLFNKKFVPTKIDDSLIEGSYVTIDGKSVIAGPNTPQEFIKGDGVTFNPEFIERNGYDKFDDLTALFPRTNREAWEKISAPTGQVGVSITDTGNTPSAPTNLSASGSTLIWNKSSSKNIVGYRVYYSDNPDGKLSLIGSTASTDISYQGNSAVFYVRAVDYFGRESANSGPVTVGKVNEPDKDEDKKTDPEPDKKPDPEPDKKPDPESDKKPDPEPDKKPDPEPDKKPDPGNDKDNQNNKKNNG